MVQGIGALGVGAAGDSFCLVLEVSTLGRETESLDTFAMGEDAAVPTSGNHVCRAEQLMRLRPLIRERESCLKPQTETLILISILIPVHLAK